MITPELLDFIEAELKAGQTPEGLLHLLREGGGWTEEDVQEALLAAKKRQHPISVAEMRAGSGSTQQKDSTLLHIDIAPPPPAPPIVVRVEPAMRMGEVIPHNLPGMHDEGVATLDGQAPTVPPVAQLVVPPPAQAPAPAIFRMPEMGEKREEKPKTPDQDPLKNIHQKDTPHLDLSAPEGLHKPEEPALPHEKTLFTPLVPVGPQGAPILASSRLPSLSPGEAQVMHASNTPAQVRGLSLRAQSSSTKKILGLIIGVVVLGLLGVGGFFLFKNLSPKPDKTFATMYASIPGIRTLRYSGESTLDFSGKVTDTLKAGFPEGYTGSAKVALKYDGRTDLSKGIDGVHQFGITADLRSGESAISVNSSIEVRIIGETYYLKITNPPDIKDIDLSRLNTYWIAVSPSDIAKRFGGVVPTGKDSYGSFGGTASTTSTARGLIASRPPFESVSRIGEEVIGGAQTIHYRFKGNPQNLLALLGFIVESTTGSPWELTPEKEANILTLLQGLSGDIWIDSTSYLPRKIVFRQPLKGSVSGIALDGALDVEQSYGEYNGTVSVVAPRPVMTYGEFADDVKRQSQKSKATGDEKRIFDAEDIVAALEVYRANNNDSYPPTLDMLVTNGLLPALPSDPEGGKYLYASYVDKTKTGKKNLCTTATSTCTFFHLGITLSGSSTEALNSDSDSTTDAIVGTDTKGCAKEAGKSCYDLTPVPR